MFHAGLTMLLCVAAVFCNPTGVFKDVNIETQDGKEHVHPRVTFASSNDSYPARMIIEVLAKAGNFTLVLRKNEISATFNSITIGANGENVSDTTSYGDCYYQGEVAKYPSWMVIMSTCHGLSGHFGETKNFFHITPSDENNTSLEADHVLYLDDGVSEGKKKGCGCGNKDFIEHKLKTSHTVKQGKVRREATGGRRYIELVIVNDYAQFNRSEKNLQKTVERSLSVVNEMNALYRPLNISIALVKAITFNARDMFPTSSNALTTLGNFTKYAYQNLRNKTSYDTIMLLTGIALNDYVGYAHKGNVCDRTFATSVVQDGRIYAVSSVGYIAAHELGHNLNMIHDYAGCSCGKSNETCVMKSSFSPVVIPEKFSNCSVSNLNAYFASDQDSCLFNMPTETVGDPQCGNGIVEGSEECDCGSPEECAAVGACCTSQCTLATYGTVCRPSTGECDIAEYCLGNSPTCPEDTHVANWVSCESGNGWCINGKCPTRNSQCRAVFTDSSDAEVCYPLNSRGDVYGFCKQNRTSYIACDPSDALCGKLHCELGNYTGIYGRVLVATITFTNGTKCRSTSKDRATPNFSHLNLGTVNDGTKCGSNHYCYSGACLTKPSRRMCRRGLNNLECSGRSRGVCNQRGECFCKVGFTGPACENIGSRGVNECERSNGGCAHYCIDTPHSFRCACRPGSVLASDQRSCHGPCTSLGFKPGCCQFPCGQPNVCYCDTQCHRYGDCCPDVPPASQIKCT